MLQSSNITHKMSTNINDQNKEHDASYSCPSNPLDIQNGYKKKLSLLHPDDIPPICRTHDLQHDKKSDNNDLVVSKQNADLYISSSTSNSDAELELSTSSNASTSTKSDTTQYSSSQLHYYRNRDKILAYAKLRYKNNRESLLAYSKKYQSERKDIVKERNITYYEANRERLLKDRALKITCECGKVIAKGSLSNHLRTAYHLRRVPKVDNREDIASVPELNSV